MVPPAWYPCQQILVTKIPKLGILKKFNVRVKGVTSFMNRRANQLAHYLARLGVGPEVRVGICMERGLEMMVGVLGVLKAGGAYVPLDPVDPSARRSYMVKDAARAIGLQATSRDNLGEALDAVRKLDLDPPPRILITGSLYLAGEVLRLNGTPPA